MEHAPRGPGWPRRERTVLGAPWSAFQGLPGPAAVTSSHENPGDGADWPCRLRALGPRARSPMAMPGSPVKPPPSQDGYTSLSPTLFPFRWGGGVGQPRANAGNQPLEPGPGWVPLALPSLPCPSPTPSQLCSGLWALEGDRGPKMGVGRGSEPSGRFPDPKVPCGVV